MNMNSTTNPNDYNTIKVYSEETGETEVKIEFGDSISGISPDDGR